MKAIIQTTAPNQVLSSAVLNQQVVQYVAYGFVAISLFLFVLLLWMRKRISLAIQIIQEAAGAVTSMRNLLAFPLFVFMLIALSTVFFLMSSMYAVFLSY